MIARRLALNQLGEILPTMVTKIIKTKEKQMNASVKILDFETASIIRDEIVELEKMLTK